jgi:hypothetical protein
MAQEGEAAGPLPDRRGRLVRAVSVRFKSNVGVDTVVPLARIADRVDREAAQGTDIIILSEHCQGCNERSQETLDGPTIPGMAGLARKLDTRKRYKRWQKRFEILKEKHSDKSDVWCSRQIAKMSNGEGSHPDTIRKHMIQKKVGRNHLRTSCD